MKFYTYERTNGNDNANNQEPYYRLAQLLIKPQDIYGKRYKPSSDANGPGVSEGSLSLSHSQSRKNQHACQRYRDRLTVKQPGR